MTGSEKQIAWAESLRDALIVKLAEHIIDLTPSGDTFFDDFFGDDLGPKIDHTDEIARTKNVITTLKNFTGYAGNLIDAIDMHYYRRYINMGEITVGWNYILENI